MTENQAHQGGSALDTFRRLSLGIKVSVVITCLLGISFGLLVSLLMSGYADAIDNQADIHGKEVVEVVEAGLNQALLSGDRGTVQAAVMAVVQQAQAIKSARVLNTEGEIVFASNPAEIGTAFAKTGERCSQCHGTGVTTGAVVARAHRATDQGRFLWTDYAKPLANRTSCWSAACHAHAQESKKLGLLEVEVVMETMGEEMVSTQQRSTLVAVLLIAMTVLILFLFVYRTVSRPLRTLRDGAAKLGELELAHRVPLLSGDEIGEIARTLNDTITYLDELLESIRQAVAQLNAATTELFATSGQQENAATDQSSAVEQTRRTMEGLVEAANEIAEGAGSMLEIAKQSMSASTVIGERIARLNDQAMRISEISEAIRGIAEKSDILALNASLEGTKAGEIGRGFALVGAEMRRLAESVMEAVVQVRQLASEIRELSQSAVLASEEGQKLAKETTETSQRITLVTNQQRTATEQVRASMDELQSLAQQTVRGATQSKATANDLMQTARALSAIIESAQHGANQGDGGSEQA